jgi:hypothetical protein
MMTFKEDAVAVSLFNRGSYRASAGNFPVIQASTVS